MTLFDGTAGRDWLYGTSLADELQGRAEADHIFGGLGDDLAVGAAGNDVLWGDEEVWGDADLFLIGGNDRLDGGSGADRLFGDGVVHYAAGSGTFVGGDDRLSGGGGNDVIYGDGFCMEAEGSTSFQGGNDRIVGGKGNDVLVGDGVGRGQDGDSFVGGADTFVFRRGDGRDVISDFGEGDVIEIVGTKLTWSVLDSDRSGDLTAADRFVDEADGGVAVDVGRALGGRADRHVIEVATGLVEADFLFV